MKSYYLLIGLILLIIGSIALVVVPLCIGESEPKESITNNNFEGDDGGSVIPPIGDPVHPDGDTVIVTPDKGESENEETNDESDEPPIGDDNINLDVSENLPPIKNPDPSASVDEVIYGTKGEADGK